MFDSGLIVHVHALLRRLVNMYDCVLDKSYEIINRWDEAGEQVTSLVILAKAVARDVSFPDIDTLVAMCDEVIMISN